MNTINLKKYDFAGSIQQNFGEYLEAAITFHFDHCDDDEVSNMPDEELLRDVSDIADNLLGPDAEGQENPDGSVYNRPELEEAIYDKIKEIYNVK